MTTINLNLQEILVLYNNTIVMACYHKGNNKLFIYRHFDYVPIADIMKFIGIDEKPEVITAEHFSMNYWDNSEKRYGENECC